MLGYFMVLAAIPGFFVSSLILMALWDFVGPRLDLADIDYVTSMLITITAWLTVAPLVAAGRRRRN